MKKLIALTLALAAGSISLHAQAPATFSWNFNLTNSTATTTDVPPTTVYGVGGFPGGNEGLVRMYNAANTPTNLLGLPGSGVSSGQYTNIQYDRALQLPGTYGSASLIVRTPDVNSAISNLGIVSNFTVTAWVKSDVAGGFVAGQFPRIFMLSATNVDAASASFNSMGVLFFNAGDIQLKVHNLNSSITPPGGSAGNGINTAPAVPLAPAATNWAFLAVTYDSTLDPTTTTNVWFYVGNRTDPLGSGVGRQYAGSTANSVPPAASTGPGYLDFSGTGVQNVFVSIGNRMTDRARGFNGRYDDIRFFANRVLTPAELEVIRTNAPPGSAGPLTVVTAPQSQVVTEGEQVQLSIETSEAPNRTYQWYRINPGSGTSNAIAGATSQFYTTPALTVATDSGAKYAVRVSSSDPSAGTVYSSYATVTVVAAASAVTVPGLVKMEYYANNAGTSVGDFLTTPPTNYPNAADLRLYAAGLNTRLMFADDSHFNYFAVLSGWITPTVTTNYVFYVRGADRCRLDLSTDNTTNNLAQIAADSNDGQQVFLGPESITPGSTVACSTPVSLTSGSNYAFRVYLKAGSGVDLAQVAWRMNSDPSVNDLPLSNEGIADRLRPIPAAYLSTVAPSNGTVSITQNPIPAGASAGGKATFTVAASVSGLSPTVIQWRKNGVNISGANSATYTTPYLTTSDNSAQFSAVVSIPGATATSSEATLTVSADSTPPTVVSAAADDTLRAVTVQFSEPLDLATALNTNNYSIPGLTVLAAAFSTDTNLVANPMNDAVKLTTSLQTSASAYTVTASGVKDAANNTIAGGNSASFRAFAVLPGYAKVGYLENQTPNLSLFADDGTVQWLAANSRKFLYDDADTIVFPQQLAFSPIGNNAIRTAQGSASPTLFVPAFGTRLRAYITPTNTGNYVFYVSADDSAILWLSTDDNPANKHIIAVQQGPAGTFQGDWANNSTVSANTSSATFDTNVVGTLNLAGATPWPVTSGGFAVITLNAGQRYYLQVDHRENAGFSSYCAVNWDNGTAVVPAAGTILSGDLISWAFPAPLITSFGQSGNNVNIAWTGAGDVNKGFLGYPGLLAGSITASYPGSSLQSAPVILGLWSSLTNTSPASFPATNPTAFFRVGQ